MYFTQLAAASLAIGVTTAVPAPTAQWGGWGNWGNWGHHGKPPGYHPGKPPGGESPTPKINVQLGPRPYYLIDNMDDGPLKQKLESCKEEPKSTSSFSISHRGAPLMFPEHSKQGYDAAARMGAGMIIKT